MKIARLSILALVVAFGFIQIGCAPKAEPPSDKQGQTAKSPEPGTPPSNDVASQSTESAPSPSDVPAELKHEAFAYSGLESTKPITYTIKNLTKKKTQTTEQTTSLKSAKDGEAIYDVDAGGIHVEYVVRKDGVYARQVAEGLEQEPQLQLPSVLTPGKTWKTTEKIAQGAQEIVTTTVCKVIGVRKIATARGSFSALLVEGEGTMTQNGKTAPIKAKTWYVKGLGVVKSDATMRTPGSSESVQVVSEIK